ncbi:sulfotransferase [Methylocystis sp. H62]|uniref:sulfotransferase family protein n=1 Tax=Methylocystis sp. H62 TaxID=2785789 RepID=UPI0018C1FCBE|nr:sulfotransferase [Methylocystis sp. H62]MBG0794477.1 sulfotransferase [Methylocystis sp. H62]
MHSVRLGWDGIDAFAARGAWRTTVALPAPRLAGLLARQWRLEARALRGFYLVRDSADLQSFQADPAYRLLSARLGETPPPVVADSARGGKLDRPVFIIAAPRSGSTLLFDLLAQAPGLWTQGSEGQGAVEGIVGLHPAERGFTSDRLTDEDAGGDVAEILRAGLMFDLRDRSGQQLDALPAGTGPAQLRILDKTTENALRVSFLAQAFPDSFFILLHRDARQSVSSLMEAWRHGGFDRFLELPDWPDGKWCFLLPPEWRRLAGRSLQDVVTAQWASAYRHALDDLDGLDRNRWAHVDYNELIAAPKRTALRLCRFLGLETDAKFEAFLDRTPALSATTISPPSSLKWRRNPALDAGRLENRVRSLGGRLRSLDLQERPAAIASPQTIEIPGVRFACFLRDVQPTASAASEELIVDPSFRYQMGNSIPLGLAGSARFRGRFLGDQPILWVRSALTESYLPFWAPREQALLYRRLEAGRPAPNLGGELAQLHAAGIVATEAERRGGEESAARTREALKATIARSGYCVIPRLIGSPHTQALARYYRTMIASDLWTAGDDQVERRHGWHNEAMAQFVQYQLWDFVSELAGEKVVPSYAYVSAYQSGAELDPHFDRKQCVYTLSFVIDESGGRSVDWPIHFETVDGSVEVTAALGDAVLFCGHDMPHWRERAPAPCLALTTLLNHYVPSKFGETLN